jgi:translation initiation factor IF-2
MSIRIHQLSKLLGLENKELIALLQSRGYENIRTASNTVDKITEESLIEEFKNKAQKSEVSEETPVEQKPAEQDGEVEEKEQEESKKPLGAPRLPPGVFVKTTEDIRREKEAKAEAARAAKQASTPPPAPIVRGATPPPPPPAPAMGARVSPQTPPQVRVVPPAARPQTPPPVTTSRPAPLTPPARPSAPAPATPLKPVAAASASENVSAPVSGEKDSAAEGSKVLHIKPPIVVRDFATMIGVKPFRLISELMEMNIFASMNQVIEEDVALKIAERHGYTLEIKHRGESKAPVEQKKKDVPVDESKFLEPRAPVVCIMGHVDHGKTTLMDAIRKSNVVEGEHGGITQHIGAYQVEHNGHKITFLDTPGHAAFSKMRERGTNLTDVVILVVAADDGFKPQTDEALKFAQKAGVPLIVAINKIDSKGANIDRVKQQMQERGIPPEDWGGETIAVPIAAIKGEGISELLEMVLLQAEIMELKANPKCPAEGIIVETQIETGRGSTCTVIVRRGTLKTGDAIVAGSHYARVRSLINDRSETVRSATPGTPVRVVGWSGNPPSGATFVTAKNERDAKAQAEEHEREQKRLAEKQVVRSTSLDDLFGSIEAGQKKQFRCVVKADVHGSVEAIVGMLNGIKSDKVEMKVVAAEVGIVTKNDVLMASTSGACILAFNTKLDNGVTPFAKHHGVVIYQHSIIYQLVDQVMDLMADLLDPELRESKLGAARVRQAFTVAKGVVAGCLVTEGRVTNSSHVRVLRDGKLLTSSRVIALKRFKDDVSEVRAGTECGIRVDRWDDFKEGDILEVYEVTKVKSSL